MTENYSFFYTKERKFYGGASVLEAVPIASPLPFAYHYATQPLNRVN